MSELDERDLREAAAEVGLSPRELETALAQRGSQLPVPGDTGSVVGKPTRGTSATHAEGRVAAPVGESVDLVRAAVETHVGGRGHRQGDAEADVVDEANRLTYRLRAVEDGSDGAIVRVDVDPSQRRASRALVTTGVIGVGATVALAGWIFGAPALLVAAGALLAASGFGWARSRANERQAIRSAFAVASRALSEAEIRRPAALPGDVARPAPTDGAD